MDEKSIGKFIATLRKANGYTQEELGEILGVSNKTISSWENGNSSPDLSLLPIIADLFNVTCDELIRGEKSKEEREIKTNKNTITLIGMIIILIICFVFAMFKGIHDGSKWN